MKSLLNLPEDVVLESIEGLVVTIPHLNRIDGYPAIKVAYDMRHNGDTTVSIISGGGSGHEPAFAGFVGKGILAAAIAGDVFAAPPEDAILAAIRQVTGKAGCLLIINNYTGDRLNFGAAAERAKAEGLSVEMVIVADDCALQQSKPRRGLAGSAFVLKCAGAVAAAGGDLQSVHAVAQHAADSVGTMACALTTCNLPGQSASSSTPSRIGEDEMEIGLGLHGEPGAYKSKVKPVDEIVTELVARISVDSINGARSGTDAFAYLPIQAKEPIAMLINNLGGITPLEMGVVSRAAVRAVREMLNAEIQRVFVGPVMTSLDMKGISISLLKLSSPSITTSSMTLLDALDAETDAPGWPQHGGVYVTGKEPTPVPRGPTDTLDSSTTKTSSDNNDFSSDETAATALVTRKCIEAACQALINFETELNDLDAKVGDGDCGSTLATGARAVLGALPRFQLNNAAAVSMSLAQAIGLNVGGTSGGIFKIFFTAAAAALTSKASSTNDGGNSKSELTVNAAALALKAGVEAVSKYGGAQRGYRTLVDALGPASDALSTLVTTNPTAPATEAAIIAADAAEKGAEETKRMSAMAGRSSYVPDAVLQGVPDPGAVGVARWMRAIAETLTNS